MGGECSRHTRKARGCRSLFARQTGSKSSRLAYYENFGLVAEEVAKVSSDLVTPDREGRPQTVRYEAINAMLLNEFLKEHHKVESQESRIQQQEATIACQQKQIDALSAGLQKVTAHLEMREAAPQTVLNNH